MKIAVCCILLLYAKLCTSQYVSLHRNFSDTPKERPGLNPSFHYRLPRTDNDTANSRSCCFGCNNPLGLKFVLTLDSYHSFILNRPSKINGIRTGMEFYKKVRTGIGLYKLDVPVELKPIITPFDSIERKFYFSYFTAFFEYILYQDYRWELSLPLSAGGGDSRVVSHPKSSNSSSIHAERKGLGLITLSAGGHYKIFHWLGVGTGLGYRQILTHDDAVRKALNSPFFILKAKLFLGSIGKAIVKPDEVRKEKETYKRRRSESRQKM